MRGSHDAYRRERGHRLQPLLFSDPEVFALTLGLLTLRELQFPIDVSEIEGAAAMTEHLLPDAVLQQVWFARGDPKACCTILKVTLRLSQSTLVSSKWIWGVGG